MAGMSVKKPLQIEAFFYENRNRVVLKRNIILDVVFFFGIFGATHRDGYGKQCILK